MEKRETFEKLVLKIALPVTVQSLLQSSFSVVDQVMIGQLGSGSIAGIGLGGKFASLYSVVLAAIAAAAGIMISQYMGKRDGKSVAKSFYINMAMSIALAGIFMVLCILFPEVIMAAYTKDRAAKMLAVKYIRILSISFVPMAVSSIVTTMLRCMEAAALPLYASIFALVLNTGLNYLLIFGKGIFPAMGVEGAALASTLSQVLSCVMVLFFFIIYKNWQVKQKLVWTERRIPKKDASERELPERELPEKDMTEGRLPEKDMSGKNAPERELPKKKIFAGKQETGRREYGKQYLKILCPLLVCEFLWSLGENVYTAIYGNIGTDECAAMTMTIPVQTMVIGALSGLAQASGILIGKSLGAGKYEKAYAESKKLLLYGTAASLLLSLLLVAVSPLYVRIYNVGPEVQEMTKNLLIVFALIAPVKVLNMILGGGIIRSGGKTKYIMCIDIIGTWGFGVPLGVLSAFIWGLPIVYVYFVLSLEECVRLGISLVVFRRRAWMVSIE